LTTVDHGQRRSRAPGQGALERECRSCAITQLVAEHGSLGAPPFLAEDIDDDVVTISGPALDGLLVVPCAHVAGLDELSSDVRAHVLAALRRALLAEAWSELEGSDREAVGWVAAGPDRGALLFSDEASVAVWRACRVNGVRAAVASDPDAVARAVDQLGMNLLVVEPLGKSISWIRQLAATFRRAGAPTPPEGFDEAREDCRCGSRR